MNRLNTNKEINNMRYTARLYACGCIDIPNMPTTHTPPKTCPDCGAPIVHEFEAADNTTLNIAITKHLIRGG